MKKENSYIRNNNKAYSHTEICKITYSEEFSQLYDSQSTLCFSASNVIVLLEKFSKIVYVFEYECSRDTNISHTNDIQKTHFFLILLRIRMALVLTIKL